MSSALSLTVIQGYTNIMEFKSLHFKATQHIHSVGQCRPQVVKINHHTDRVCVECVYVIVY